MFQVGDGTTSVIVLAGEMLAAAEQFLEQQMHPTVIIRQYRQALEDIITMLEGPLSVPIDKNDKAALANVVSGFWLNIPEQRYNFSVVLGERLHWYQVY